MTARTIAVLGLGSIGLRHAGNLLYLGQRVIGFDPSAERRAAFEATGGQATQYRGKAIAKAEAVAICSPNRFHVADIADALAAGRHVFIEKPMVCTAAGVSELLDTAEHKGLVLFPGHNLRLHPAARLVRQWLTEGKIGTPLWGHFQVSLYLPSFRAWQDHKSGYAADSATGGAIFDNIHEIDLARYLFGPFKVVACNAVSSGSIGIPSDDCADILCRHENGAQSVLHLDLVTRPRLRQTTIAGTAGRIGLDLDARRALLYGLEGDVLFDQSFPGAYKDDYVAEMSLFLECLEGRASPPCSAREAFEVLQSVFLARHMAGLPTA